MLQSGTLNELFVDQILFTKKNNVLYVSHYKSGVNFMATVNRYGGGYYINYEMKIPNIHRLKTRGFMGNLDGNKENEFFRRVYADSGNNLLSIPNSYSNQQLSTPLHSCKAVLHVSNYCLLHHDVFSNMQGKFQMNLSVFFLGNLLVNVKLKTSTCQYILNN